MASARNPFRVDTPRLVRPIDHQFASALEADKAIVRLIGPRRVGKTELVSFYARSKAVPLLAVTLKAIPADVAHPGEILWNILDKEFQALADVPHSAHKKLHAAVAEMEKKQTRSTSRTIGSEIGAAFAGLTAKLSAARKDEQPAKAAPYADPDIEIAYRLRRLELAAVKLKMRPIILFDEIQELVLARPEVPTVWAIRNEIQHHTACRYVFAGSNQRLFSQLDSGPRAPLLHLGTAIAVPPLTGAEVDEWAVPVFRRGGRQLDSLRAATSLMAGKIGEVAEVCATLWDMTKPGEMLFDAKQREALLHTVLTTQTTQPQIRTLSARQTHVLRFVGLNPGINPLTRMNTEIVNMNPGTIKRSLDALVAAGLVEAFSQHQYALATPLSTLAALYPIALHEPLRRATVSIATEAAARQKQDPRFRIQQ